MVVRPKLAGVSQPTPTITPPQVDATRDEIELFHYFRVVISDQITGAFDDDSWTVNLLQAIQQQPAIWNACIAASAMHRVYIHKPSVTTSLATQRDALYMTGLKQYHSSLKHILSITQQDVVSMDEKLAVLAANLLFLALSWFRGDMVEGFKHLSNGLVLIAQWDLLNLVQEQKGPRRSTMLPAESLMLTYLRADSSTMDSREAETSALDNIIITPVITDDKFLSPSDAYFELEFLWNAVMKIMRKGPLAASPNKIEPPEQLLNQFRPMSQRWGAKLMQFKNSADYKDSQMDAIIVLKVRHILIDVMLALDSSESESSWDAFDKHFSNMIDMAETLTKRLELSIERKQSRGAGAGSIAGLAVSMTEPLAIAAWRCRNHALRHRALDIVRRIQIRHYPTDHTITAKIAEIVVNAEESIWESDDLSCACIPKSNICLGHRIVYRRLQWAADGDYILFLKTKGEVLLNTPANSFSVMQWTWTK